MTIVKGEPNAPFLIATTSFPGCLHLSSVLITQNGNNNGAITSTNLAHLRRVETSIEKIKKRTSCYIPIANWSYKAYSLFHFDTGTTTTVFDLPDNLHG